MKIISLWLFAALLLCASISNAQSYGPIYSTFLEFKNGTFKLRISPSAVSASDTLILPSVSSPGALVNDGTGLLSWTPMTSPSWHLIGNSGTNPDSNFIGTIDNVSVIHKTNNIEQFRVFASGGISLPPTQSSGRGIIFVDTVRFMHSYGTENTFLGPHAGNLVLTGYNNTGLGEEALVNLGNGRSNTAVGRHALVRINNDSNNTAVGAGALSELQSGNYNTAIGFNTGITDTVTSGNTLIGAFASVGNNRDNATAIGYRAFADFDDVVVLGSVAGVNGADQDARVGIGTSQPTESLEIMNGDIIVTNTNNFSGTICIQEPSDSGFAVVSLLAPPIPGNSDVWLWLPPDQGDEYSVLSSNGSGWMYWQNPVSDSAMFNTIVRRDSNTGGFTAGRIVIANGNGIRFNDLDNSAYAEIIPQAAITTSYTLTLPPDDGSTGQFLQTDGTGGLSWADAITSVSVDSTLTGDGTSGNPLGVDLTSANTWTGTQTFPATTDQGDSLILSINAGTTTIDAARIGNGITNTQVDNNLTIDGGVIDNTPIGATTESTGKFTTVEATTVLGAATTPNAGTYYRDNATIAWGDIAAAGVVNDQFGNFAVVHTPGTGVYTVTLPNAPTAAATVVTLQSLGLTTVTRAGAALTITTYDTTGTPTDLDFYFITTGRP